MKGRGEAGRSAPSAGAKVAAIIVGTVLVVTIWFNTVELSRSRKKPQVTLYAKQTESVYIVSDERKTSQWTSSRSLLESENWDEENGRCGDEGDTCTLTFRFQPQPIWSSDVVINGTRGILDIPQPQTGRKGEPPWPLKHRASEGTEETHTSIG